jgi:hypothetical protein
MRSGTNTNLLPNWYSRVDIIKLPDSTHWITYRSTPYLNISIDKPGVASDELPEGTSVLYEKKERVEHGRK